MSTKCFDKHKVNLIFFKLCYILYVDTINNLGGLNMFTYNQDVTATDCEPGVTRKILSYSDELMMVEVSFAKGAKGNLHSHEHLQISYVAKGSFEFTIDGQTKVVTQGDSLYMPSNSIHGVFALEDAILVDVFNPKRDDFLK